VVDLWENHIAEALREGLGGMVKISEELGGHDIALVMQPGKHVGGGWCACLSNDDVTSVGASVAKGVGSLVDGVDCGWIQGWARVLMSRASPKREEWEGIGLVVGIEGIDLVVGTRGCNSSVGGIRWLWKL
jgi:hypothetical protein